MMTMSEEIVDGEKNSSADLWKRKEVTVGKVTGKKYGGRL